MSLGRNDPCSCGSGKKYKKCCMNLASRPTLANASPAIVNERIAYEGRVGRERKLWCEQFLNWKIDQLDKIATGQKQIQAKTGHHVTCSKGCSACCSQHVGASIQECDAIVYWLHQHTNIRAAFMDRYPHWRSRLRDNDAVFQRVTQSASIVMSNPPDRLAHATFMQEAEKYLLLDIACPFLDNGICSIYPVRPFVCAIQIVVSPPEHCAPSSKETPILLFGAPAPAPQESYFRGPKDTVMYASAPQLVHEIIAGGYFYLNDLPGMAGLESEFFRDPSIQALIK